MRLNFSLLDLMLVHFCSAVGAARPAVRMALVAVYSYWRASEHTTAGNTLFNYVVLTHM